MKAAAALLGVSTVTTGQVLADHNEDDVYETVAGQFDDVTAFEGSRADDMRRDLHYRIYDADTETVAYATRAEGTSGKEVATVIRDASGTDIAS